jgi:hypothetical protein
MDKKNETLVSMNKSWWERYFASGREEQLKMIRPTSAVMAYGAGICDRHGWFIGDAKRRDEIIAKFEGYFLRSGWSLTELELVFTQWSEVLRDVFFGGRGFSKELRELYALFERADENRRIIDQIVASKSKDQELNYVNPDWRVSLINWNRLGRQES